MSDALPASAAVGVVGAGAMGSGIAQVAAAAGHPVRLFDARADSVERARAAIGKDLAGQVAKGRLQQEDADATLDRIRGVSSLAEMDGCGLVIEAIVEDRVAKRTLFAELEPLVGEQCIIASNTSSISITDLAAGLAAPGRVVGMHFFNPVPRMALVEVIDGLRTDLDIAATLMATARAWGKTPVRARSTPGFIVNRVARPFYGEAMRTLTEQAAAPEVLDALIRDCGGFPMGPCTLMDFIGLDVNLAVSGSTFEALGWDRRYAPSLIQQELVRAGRYGRKTGGGFYGYGEHDTRPEAASEPPCEPPRSVIAPVDAGHLEPLVGRMAAAGLNVRRVMHLEPMLHVGSARLALSDGRTATQRGAQEGTPNFVTLDLALDFARTSRLGVARADQCGESEYREVVGALQTAGCAVTRVDDIAGMVVMRTVAMLVNEAADVVTQGIATAADIDTAMALGTRYPVGPLAWCDRLSAAFVSHVLDNLRAHYGEDRYRVSPALQRRRWSGARFHE
ncbi:MAG: 3-hydroxyacyl-CoA dehydrogenase [Betaproteobacteria bacterium]|nr:3-hydroxyacyl-CoA dehydrogenase [Betaproteobacteria bacterium]